MDHIAAIFNFDRRSIRFRRWSRSSYALFAAVKSVVSIGSLAVDIVNQALLKTNSVAFVGGDSSHLSPLQRSISEVLSCEL